MGLVCPSSSQPPYPSFRRKRQNSLIPVLLLSPQSLAALPGPLGGSLSGRAHGLRLSLLQGLDQLLLVGDVAVGDPLQVVDH